MVYGRPVSTHQRQLLRRRARTMRHAPTATEYLLWQALKGAQLGVTFRRQVVLCGYIADFYASSAKLVVEVDGACHEQQRGSDRRRDRVLRRAGYRVLRVSDAEVVRSLAVVVSRIRHSLGAG